MSDKLHILIPGEFISEKLYVLDVILKEYLNISYSIEVNTAESDYIFILPNGNRVLFKNVFFKDYNEKQGYLKKENLPVFIKRMTNNFTSEKQLPIIFGTDEIKVSYGEQQKAVIFGLDMIASIFFMLTRWEEFVNPARDQYGRFPAKASCALKHNFLQRPIVNEYCLLLQQVFLYLGFTDFSPAFRFKIIPTHDVDNLLYFDGFRGFAKKIAGDIIRRKSIVQTKSDLLLYWQILTNKKYDPYDTYDELMTLSEENNLQSIFFFMTGFTKDELPYSVNKGFGKSLLKKITERNHLIGLHAGFNTSSDEMIYRKQKDLLNLYTGKNLTLNRQHFLNFSVPQTWGIVDSNKIAKDFTLGYPENDGFRTGTCFSYPVYDFVNRKKLDLYEQPLIAMDTTLVHYKKLSPDECFNRLSALIRTVKRYNGEFVLLWHNSNWNLSPWQDYQSVYRAILKMN